MMKRGDPGRDKDVQDVIVKVILPSRREAEMEKDPFGFVLATVQGQHRYRSTRQPISTPVFRECYSGRGGGGYYIADYSPLLKMWILGERLVAQQW